MVPKLNFQRESLVTLLLTNPVQNASTIKLESPEKTDEDSDEATAKVNLANSPTQGWGFESSH